MMCFRSFVLGNEGNTMTELADRLSRHADLHEHQPWADDEQMQFARDLREAVGLIAELARLRAQKPAAWVRQYHHSGVLCWENEGGNCAPLYRAAPPAQPAEPVQRLSDEQIDAILHEAGVDEFAAIPIEYDRQVARAIESALQPGWRPEWPAFVEYWTHESHLQTFADRERFRAAAKAMLEAAPKATK